ncbi:hypothetical protein JFL47_00640 [Haemophilus haemoglobinophilus]|nr:hypothetical protein [Canicola haemoglobinophilus]
MKKIYLLTALTSALILSGCGDDFDFSTEVKSKAFYAKNLKQAQKVKQNCEDILDNSRDALKKYIKGLKNVEEKLAFEAKLENFKTNCNHADNALFEQKQEEWKQKDKQRELELEKEKQQEQAKQQIRRKEVNDYFISIQKNYEKLTWQDIINTLINENFYVQDSDLKEDKSASEQFAENYNIREYIESEYYKDKWLENREKQAKYYIFLDAAKKGLKELIQKDYPTLRDDSSFCATDRREYSVCSVWQRALKVKENMVIQDYVDNYDNLKTAYNQCLADIDTKAAEFENLEEYTIVDRGYRGDTIRLKAPFPEWVNDSEEYLNKYKDYAKRNYMQNMKKDVLATYPCAQATEALQILKLPLEQKLED